MLTLPRITKVLVPAIAAAICGASSAQPLVATGYPMPAFDKAAYDARLRKAFDGDVMGYATVLIKNGQVVSQIAGGKARSAIDGNVDMSVYMPANVGSTIKFTGGIALLQLLESKDPNINPQGLTVDQRLDSPIWPYLPARWQNVMHSSILGMSFRQVLTHQSGFRALGTADTGTDKVKRFVDYLIKGVQPANVGVRDYENANISLVTYLIPMVANPALRATVNMEAAKFNWHPEGLEIHNRIADAWEQHMFTKVYGKTTPQISPSCNPTVEYVALGKTWALDYTSKTDPAKGATRDERVKNGGYCQAQGGWYLTARELAAFVANFHAAGNLVTPGLRDRLFDDDNIKDAIVWSFAYGDKAINEKFNYSSLPYMGGDHGGAHATIVALPGGYYGIGIINSNDFNSKGVTARLVRAYKTGLGMPEDPYCASHPQQLQEAVSKVAAMTSAYEKALAGGNTLSIFFAKNNLDTALKALAGVKAAGEAAVCSM